MPEASAVPLRPITIGHIVDRAIDVTIRHLRPLVVLLLGYALPLAVVRYFANRESLRMFDAIIDATRRSVQHLPATKNPVLDGLTNGDPRIFFSPAAIAVYLLTFFFAPLVTAALLEALRGYYLGDRVELAAAYRLALRRWLGLIGVNVLYGGFALLGYLAIIIVAVVVGLLSAGGFVVLRQHGLGAVAVAVASLLVLAAMVVGIVFVGLAIVAYGLTIVTVIVEDCNPLLAVGRAIGLMSGRALLRRAIGFAIAALACVTAYGIVLEGGLGLILFTTHSAEISQIFATVVELVASIAAAAGFVIYYFDVRVRREGLDLVVIADGLRPLTVTA